MTSTESARAAAAAAALRNVARDLSEAPEVATTNRAVADVLRHRADAIEGGLLVPTGEGWADAAAAAPPAAAPEPPDWRGIFEAADNELHTAYRALGDAADWLRSDPRPGSGPAPDGRAAAFDAIGGAKAAINDARSALSRGG